MPSSRYVTPRAVVAAIETIIAELRERVGFFRQGRASSSRPSASSSATRFDLEMLQEGHRKGIENYTRHLSQAAAGRPAAHAGGLPAADADVRGREPRHARWPVRR